MIGPDDPAYTKIKETYIAYLDAEKSADHQATKAFIAAQGSNKNKKHTDHTDAMYELSLVANAKAADAKDALIKAIKYYRRIKNAL